MTAIRRAKNPEVFKTSNIDIDPTPENTEAVLRARMEQQHHASQAIKNTQGQDNNYTSRNFREKDRLNRDYLNTHSKEVPDTAIISNEKESDLKHHDLHKQLRSDANSDVKASTEYHEKNPKAPEAGIQRGLAEATQLNAENKAKSKPGNKRPMIKKPRTGSSKPQTEDLTHKDMVKKTAKKVKEDSKVIPGERSRLARRSAELDNKYFPEHK